MANYEYLRSACSAVCEMLKTVETLEGSSIYFKDAYYILDYLTTTDYSHTDLVFVSDGDSLKKHLFYGLPKHRDDCKYYNDFAEMRMPPMTKEEIRYNYPCVAESSAVTERGAALYTVVSDILAPLFVAYRSIHFNNGVYKCAQDRKNK